MIAKAAHAPASPREEIGGKSWAGEGAKPCLRHRELGSFSKRGKKKADKPSAGIPVLRPRRHGMFLVSEGADRGSFSSQLKLGVEAKTGVRTRLGLWARQMKG